MSPLSSTVATKLQTLASNDRDFAYILRHVGTKRRLTPHLDTYRIYLEISRGGYLITEDAVQEVFDKLQKLGLGKFNKKRRPAHSSFTCSQTPIQDVAEIALGRDQLRNKAVAAQPLNPATILKPSQTHTIDLYATIGGRLIHLQLPADFGAQDAKELSSYLEQLAASRSS